MLIDQRVTALAYNSPRSNYVGTLAHRSGRDKHFDFATGDQAIATSIFPGKCTAMKLTRQMGPLH
jgi:hypothetical protein